MGFEYQKLATSDERGYAHTSRYGLDLFGEYSPLLVLHVVGGALIVLDLGPTAVTGKEGRMCREEGILFTSFEQRDTFCRSFCSRARKDQMKSRKQGAHEKFFQSLGDLRHHLYIFVSVPRSTAMLKTTHSKTFSCSQHYLC